MIKKWFIFGVFAIMASIGLTASSLHIEKIPESVLLGVNSKEVYSKEQPTPLIMPSLTPAISPTTVSPSPVPLKFLDMKKYPVAQYSKVMNTVESVNITVKSPKLRYLIENGITIEKVDIKEYDGAKTFQVSYPRISGLINKEIQDKINKDFKEFADSLVLYGKTNKEALHEIQSYYQVGVNSNNILCISFQTQYYLQNKMLIDNTTFVYELVEGKRLELKDLFGPATNYVDVLNSLVKAYILEHNLDEGYLKKPFQGIREEQAFYLNENKFYLKIDMKNDEFVSNVWYMMPLDISDEIKDLPGINDIYVRYPNIGKIYIKESENRKYLPNDIVITPLYKSELVQNKYNIQVSGLNFSKSGNFELEKTLNNWCKPVIPSDFISQVLKVDDKANRMSFYNKRYDVRANFMDYLCIMSSEEQNINGGVNRGYTWDAASYNIKSSKKLRLQDLFIKGFDYRKAIEDIVISKKQGNPPITSNDLKKVLDGDPKFHFDYNTLVIDVSQKSASEIDGNQKSIYMSFKELGEKNIVFNTIE